MRISYWSSDVCSSDLVLFELFRGKLKTALVKGGLRRSDGTRKNAAGRKPWDEVLIFKVLVLQALYNLSDDQMEYQLRDRLSFMRFVGFGLGDAVADRSEEHTSALQSLMRNSYAVFCSKIKIITYSHRHLCTHIQQ